MKTLTTESKHLAQLIAEISNGSDRAFHQLHRLTRTCLYGVALRLMRQPYRAEEVLQEAYINIWKGARRFRPTLGTPMTWLITSSCCWRKES